MDFDHRPGEVKVGSIQKLMHNPEKLKAELLKCDLVCACCHRIRTFTRGAFISHSKKE